MYTSIDKIDAKKIQTCDPVKKNSRQSFNQLTYISANIVKILMLYIYIWLALYTYMNNIYWWYLI